MTSKFNLEDSAEIDFPQPSEEDKSLGIRILSNCSSTTRRRYGKRELEWEYLRLLFMLHSQRRHLNSYFNLKMPAKSTRFNTR